VSSQSYAEELAQRRYAIGQQLQDYRLKQAEQRGARFKAEYKPWYEEYITSPEYRSVAEANYLTEGQTNAMALGWAERNPEFKESRLQNEAKMTIDYPNLYPAWQQSISTEKFSDWAMKEQRPYYMFRTEQLTAPRAKKTAGWA